MVPITNAAGINKKKILRIVLQELNEKTRFS